MGRGARSLSQYSSLLRNRGFVTFLLAGTLSFAAPTTALIVLQTEVALAYTGQSFSALALSFLGLAATVPTLAAAVVSGTLADRYDRRWLLRLIGGIALAATLVITLVFALAPSRSILAPGPAGFYLPLWFLLAIPLWAALMAAVTIFRPTFNAALPRLVEGHQLGVANGLLYAFIVVVSASAQVITGLLVDHAGAAIALTVPLLLFLGAELLLFRIAPAPAAPRATDQSFLIDAQEGYRYLGRRRELLAVTVGALAINFLSALAFVQLAAYSVFYLGQGAGFLGYLYAAGTLGAGLGAIAINRIRFERHLGRILGALTLGMAGCLAAFSFTHSPLVALGVMFLFGMFPGMFQTAFMAGVQATVPNQLLGRVFAADEVGSLAFVPVGQYVGGAMVFEVGLGPTYLAAGAGMALVGLGLLGTPVVGRFRYEPSSAPSEIPPGALFEYPVGGPILEEAEAARETGSVDPGRPA